MRPGMHKTRGVALACGRMPLFAATARLAPGACFTTPARPLAASIALPQVILFRAIYGGEAAAKAEAAAAAAAAAAGGEGGGAAAEAEDDSVVLVSDPEPDWMTADLRRRFMAARCACSRARLQRRTRCPIAARASARGGAAAQWALVASLQRPPAVLVTRAVASHLDMCFRNRRPTREEQQMLARNHHKYRLRFRVDGCLSRPPPHFEWFAANFQHKLLGTTPQGHAVLLIRVRRHERARVVRAHARTLRCTGPLLASAQHPLHAQQPCL